LGFVGWVTCVVGCVIPASYKTGTGGDIRRFYEQMLISSLIQAKQGGAGPVLVITGQVPVKNVF